MTKKEFLKFYKKHKSNDLSVFDFDDEIDSDDGFSCLCGKTTKTFIDAYNFKEKWKQGKWYKIRQGDIFLCYHCAYLINVLDYKSKCRDCGKKDTLSLSEITGTGWICEACIKRENDDYDELCNKECFPSND